MSGPLAFVAGCFFGLFACTAMERFFMEQAPGLTRGAYLVNTAQLVAAFVGFVLCGWSALQ